MQKSPLSIRIIYVLTSIVYYISILLCSLGVILSIVIMLGLIPKDLQLHVEMPVEVNFKEVGTMNYDSRIEEIEIVEAIGKVHFINTPPDLARWLAIPLFIVFPALFWVVFLFHRFIRNVNEGRVFHKKNYILLRRLGYSLMVLWLIMVVYMQVFNHALVSRFKFDLVEVTNNTRWFGGILVGGLFVLVLSQVFLKGKELEEENELTI